MNSIATELVWTLARTTLYLTLAGLAAAAVLRLARANWPAAHRLGSTLVLLVGWAFLSWNVTIPWYDAPVAPTSVAIEPPAVVEPIELSQLEPTLVMSEPTMPLADEPFVSSAAPMLPASSTREACVEASWAWPAWPIVAASLWLVGIAVLPGIWLVGYLTFVKSLPPSREVDPAWQGQWDDLLSAAGVRHPIPLRITAQLGPMLCRMPRGYELLVPESLWQELDAGQRRAVLRHELAHWVRGDVWKSLVVRLLALPHWFNPMSWYAARRFDEAAEWACDLAATADLPATTYAKALLRLGCTGSETPIYGSAVRGRALAARIRRLLKSEQKEDSTMKKVMLLACGLILVGLTVVRLELVAKEPSAVDPPASEKPAATVVDAEPAAPADTTDEVVDDEKPSDLSIEPRSMVEEARTAFDAIQVAYGAETATLEAVYSWSLRWMRAADSAAKNAAGKIAAAKGHLKRMQELQEKIAALWKAGARGGESIDLAAANYYVAEAKKHLADVQIKPSPAGYPASTAVTADEKRLSARPKATNTSQIDVIDLQIKIAELEGQLKQTLVEIDAARARADAANRLHQDNQITHSELLQRKADQSKLVTHAETLREQLKLYKQKLKLYEQAAAGPIVKPGDVSNSPISQQPRPQGVPAGLTVTPVIKGDAKKPTLLYDGKSFEDWADVLQNELSPGRRTDALEAMAAFGANGYGPQATKQIINVMRSYSVVGRSTQASEPVLKSAARHAFDKIPSGDALPLVMQALKSENTNQRLFAMMVLPRVSGKPEKAIPLLAEMAKDQDPDVARYAMNEVCVIDPTAPALVSMLREALASKDEGTVTSAIDVITGRSQKTLGNAAAFGLPPQPLLQPTFASLFPDLVALLDREETVAGLAQRALFTWRDAAIPALQEGAKSQNDKIRDKAQKMLNGIQERLGIQVDSSAPK